jgi:fermentation-respiration switch protein FrsA (DUF1100 family)
MMMLFERSLVYPIPPHTRGDWNPRGLTHEDVWFHSTDGTRLHGWFVPHSSPKRAILYCHGNAEHVADNDLLVAELRDRLQASVFIFDYRGYGRSEGRPDEAGCIADARAARDWLAEKTVRRPREIVLMGRSLGGGVATALAGQSGAEALVIENSFSSLHDVAAIHYPWLPIRWVMDNRYDAISDIRRYDGPLFQSHGSRDTIVPVALGRRLFDAAQSSRKRFVEFPHLGHNDRWPESYLAELAKFLDECAADHNGAPPD